MNLSSTSGKKGVAVGVTAAIASSLCCITPVLAAVAGVGSLAGSFHWLAPARPWLIGLSVLALGFAWWLKLRPAPVDDCACEVPEKKNLFQRTGFLVTVTVFAAITSAYPLYAGLFNTKASPSITLDQSTLQHIVIDVKGMTCSGCEAHVSGALMHVDGVVNAEASYEQGTATVTYDPSRTDLQQLFAAIDSTGYNALDTRTP